MKRILWCIMPAAFLLAACASVPDESEPSVSTSPQKSDASVVVEETETEATVTAEGPSGPEQPAETEQTTEPDAEPAVDVVVVEEPPLPVFLLEETRVILANGVVDTITTSVYEDDLLTEERQYYPDGTPSGLVSYAYDAGHLVRRTRTDGFGNVLSAHAYVYDRSGNLIRDSLLDTQGDPIFSYAYGYDGKRQRTQLKIFASDDILLSYSTYHYEDGKNVRVDNYSTLDVLQEYLVRDFDSKGRPVLEVITEVGGQELEKVRLSYSKGVLVRRESTVRTRKTGAEEYSYDEFENLIQRVRFDRTGKAVETNEYTYIEVSADEK